MNGNLIQKYMDYKVNRLARYGEMFYLENANKDFIIDKLKKYCHTYINTYYYHQLETLEGVTHFDLITVEEELKGKKLELLDEYSCYELLDSNEEYTKNREIIRNMVEIVLFLAKLDQLKYTSKEEIQEKVIELLENNISIKEKIGTNVPKLISEVKATYAKENKIFRDDNPYFIVDYSKVLQRNEIFFIKLSPNIKRLKANYKEALVSRVYNDEELDIEKAETLVFKIAREILAKVLDGVRVEKYFIEIPEKLFQRNKLIILEMINNPILKKHLVLTITYNTFNLHKEYIKKLDFEFCCIQDLLHINNISEKLSEIDNQMFFKYILVTMFKDKDEEELINFSCREGVQLFINKED